MKRFLIPVLAVLLLASCTQETEISIAPDITSVEFGPEGGSFDAVIFTNGHWTASCEDEAVAFSPASGDYTLPIHVEVGENTEMFTKAIRLALVTKIDENSRSSRIVITQHCRPFVYCEEPSKTVGPEGGSVRFSVNSNRPWTVVNEPPVPVDPVSAGPNRTEVTLSVPRNDGNVERTFTVRLALVDDPSVWIDLTVVQSA